MSNQSSRTRPRAFFAAVTFFFRVAISSSMADRSFIAFSTSVPLKRLGIRAILSTSPPVTPPSRPWRMPRRCLQAVRFCPAGQVQVHMRFVPSRTTLTWYISPVDDEATSKENCSAIYSSLPNNLLKRDSSFRSKGKSFFCSSVGYPSKISSRHLFENLAFGNRLSAWFNERSWPKNGQPNILSTFTLRGWA